MTSLSTCRIETRLWNGNQWHTWSSHTNWYLKLFSIQSFWNHVCCPTWKCRVVCYYFLLKRHTQKKPSQKQSLLMHTVCLTYFDKPIMTLMQGQKQQVLFKSLTVLCCRYWLFYLNYVSTQCLSHPKFIEKYSTKHNARLRKQVWWYQCLPFHPSHCRILWLFLPNSKEYNLVCLESRTFASSLNHTDDMMLWLG